MVVVVGFKLGGGGGFGVFQRWWLIFLELSVCACERERERERESGG